MAASVDGKVVKCIEDFLEDPFKFMDSHEIETTEKTYDAMTNEKKKELLDKIKKEFIPNPNTYIKKIHSSILSEIWGSMEKPAINEVISRIEPEFVTRTIGLQMNPNETPTGYAVGRVYNISREFCGHLDFLSMESFMYRMCYEYEDLFHLTEVVLTDEQKKTVEIRKKIIKDFLDHLFKYSPVEHVRKLSTKNTDDDTFEVAGIKVPMVPVDTYNKWKSFEESNYETMLEFVQKYFDLDPGLDYGITIFKTFAPEQQEKANRYATEEGRRLGVPLISFPIGSYTSLAPYAENRLNTTFTARENEAFRRIMTSGIDNEKAVEKVLSKRVTNAAGRDAARNGKHDPELHTKYHDVLGKSYGMGQTAEKRKQMEEQLREEKILLEETKLEPLSEDLISDTALDVKVLMVGKGKVETTTVQVESGDFGAASYEAAEELRHTKGSSLEQKKPASDEKSKPK